jgi:hypothetical protein
MNTFVKCALTAVAILMAHSAPAATCALAITNNVSTNAGCQTGSINNDKLGSPPIQVNIDAMFGISNWAFLAKDNDLDGVNEGSNPLGLWLSGGLESGTWSINSNAFILYSSLMLVLKGSNPNSYVGYLLNSTTGSYATTFFNKKGKGQGISHVSLYGVLAPAAVPVPAAGLMLMGALGALSLARRRKNT